MGGYRSTWTRKTAACALALSLFLLAGFSGARAEFVPGSYDADGSGGLDQHDVECLLEDACGCYDEESADSIVVRTRGASGAAALARYVSGASAALPDIADGGRLDLLRTREKADRYVRAEMAPDLTGYRAKLKKYKLNQYDSLASARDVFVEMTDEINGAARDAATGAATMLRKELAGTGGVIRPASGPQRAYHWKEIAALYRTYGPDLPAKIAAAAAVDLVATDNGVFSLSLELPLFEEVACQGEREQFMQCRFALCYLNTVYDDDGAVKDYEKYPVSEVYLKTLIHPLQADYLIKNGWYDNRDRGTRRHTGTDITAPSRTPIYSMTDGVVLYIGYSAVPGNYVMIRDPYGFEYHYYHMVEQSKQVTEGQFVKQGDCIGLVGSTGNSAANHLHLTVVSPEFTYINPYDMFLDAGIGPIRPVS